MHGRGLISVVLIAALLPGAVATGGALLCTAAGGHHPSCCAQAAEGVALRPEASCCALRPATLEYLAGAASPFGVRAPEAVIGGTDAGTTLIARRDDPSLKLLPSVGTRSAEQPIFLVLSSLRI